MAGSKRRVKSQWIAARARGAQLLEFAAALSIFTLVILPIANLSMVPIRWMLLQDAVNNFNRQLALCDTFSECCLLLEQDSSFKSRIQSLSGIAVESCNVQLRITRTLPGQESEIIVRQPGKIPPEWLPNGSNAPCIYSLELNVQSLISPALLTSIAKGKHSLHGINSPFPILVTSSHEWGNLGRNPVNGKFFFNE